MSQVKKAWMGAVAACGAGLAAVALAHGGMERMDGKQGMQRGGMHGGAMAMGGMHGTESAARLDALKTELGLNAQQTAAFDAYAATLRDQAAARNGMRERMHSGAGGDHAAMRETMHAWQREAAREREASREALYAVLTPEQRAIADRALAPRHMAAGTTPGGGHRH